MIFPLHHCDAIGCQELISPRELMCRRHWCLVSDETTALLVTAGNPQERLEAELLARGDVLIAEGAPGLSRLAADILLSKPDASQAEPHSPASPSAAGRIRKKTS